MISTKEARAATNDRLVVMAKEFIINKGLSKNLLKGLSPV